jgi:hypothetical protein
MYVVILGCGLYSLIPYTPYMIDRMPQPIGKFISDKVYRSRLWSSHKITDPSCVTFVDVSPPHGEEIKSGFSWKVDIRQVVQAPQSYLVT